MLRSRRNCFEFAGIALNSPELPRVRRNCFQFMIGRLHRFVVTFENFLRVLTGRHENFGPRSKRLLSDEGSHILLCMTAHGGHEFLKPGHVQGNVDYGRWRVRYMVANQQYELCESVGSEPTKYEMLWYALGTYNNVMASE
ncbi:peptidase C13 family protein [Tanacetum coccineum]